MKRNILVLLALAVAVFSMALPLNLALAKGPTGSARAGIARIQAKASANTAKLKLAAQVTGRQSKQQVAVTQAVDPCANDTPDGQEVSDGADTDNVDLQCGDQTGPDEQVQDETPGAEATAEAN